MRAPDLMEVLIAVGAATTVIGAILSILWRVTRGSPETQRLERLKAEFAADDKSDPAKSTAKTSAAERSARKSG